MKTQTALVLLSLLSSFNAYQYATSNKVSDKPVIMPPPSNLTSGSISKVIDPCNFNLQVNDVEGSHHVKDISQSYIKRIFKSQYQCSETKTVPNGVGQLLNLKITINSNVNELLSSSIHKTDESYSISINEDSSDIELSANEYVGVVRGLSTLLQLIKKQDSNFF
jgi:hypothetical protein